MLTATGKHRGVVGGLVLVGLVLMLGVPPGFIARAQVERRSDRKASGFVPEPVLYRTLFHTVFLLNEEAEEAERAGRTEVAQALRCAFRKEAGLGAEESAVLDRVAAECEAAVRGVDGRAREILVARRANYPDGKLGAGQQPLPPSPELLALQREREVVVLRYRDRLREAFGRSVWERFQQRVWGQIGAGMHTGPALPRSGIVKTSLTSPLVQAQQGESVITGATLISYDAYTNLVTAVATTELDYAAQDWYRGQVSCSLRDSHGNPLVSRSAYDTDGDGTVSVIVQTAGQDQMTYAAHGLYGARAEIEDFNLGGGWYIDYWGYQQVIVGDEGRIGYYYIYVPFYARGPMRVTRVRDVLARATSPVTVTAGPEITSGSPTFTANPITVNTGSTHVDVTVTASAEGLQSGDFAVLEIIVMTPPPGRVAFATPPGQVVNVHLVPGQTTTGRFTIASVNETGEYTFKVRIYDVRRPDGQGGAHSILNRVVVNDGAMTNPPLRVESRAGD